MRKKRRRNFIFHAAFIPKLYSVIYKQFAQQEITMRTIVENFPWAKIRLENINIEAKVKKKMALLEDWITWSITLIENTLQKEAIDFSCKIPCFYYLKEAKKVFQTYLTLQFKYKPSCSKIIGITVLRFNRHTREE